MADDDVFAPHVQQHWCADLARECSINAGINVLRSDRDRTRFHGFGDQHEIRKRRTKRHFYGKIGRHARANGSREGFGLGGGLVHLPVAGDEFRACHSEIPLNRF